MPGYWDLALSQRGVLYAPTSVNANPVLNGMGHMDDLGGRFGAAAVLGGQCVISVTLDGDGHILHLNDTHGLSFGEQNGETSARAEAIASTDGLGYRIFLVRRYLAMDVILPYVM